MRPGVALLLILAAALALRLADLGGESLWLDEGVAIRMASMPLQGTIAATASDVHPPLFRSLLHVWISLMGRSERSARLLSALVGTFSVFLVAGIGFRLLGGGRFGGLLAAALLALSPIAIRYSQDATSYALYVCVALISYFFFLRWLAGRRLADGLGYAVSTAALLYVHNTAWFTWAAQWVTLLLALPSAPSPRGNLVWRWFFLQAAVLALYAPWLPVLLHQLGQVGGDFWIPRPTLRTLAGTALDFGGSPWMLAVIAIAAIAGVLARPADAGWQAWPSPLVVLVPWLVLPIAGPYLASYVFAPIFLTRVTLVALPALFLLAGRGVASIRMPKARAACAALLLLGTAQPLVSYYRDPNKERWREAVSDLETWAGRGDLVLVNSGFCKENVVDYYLRRRDLEVVPFPEDHTAVLPADLTELRRLIAGHHRIWLFRSHGGDGSGAVPEVLAQALPHVVERDYPQVNYRWSPAPPYVGVVLVRYDDPPFHPFPTLGPNPPSAAGR